MVLMRKDLWSCIEGTNADVQKSNKALALIGLSVKFSQIVLIQDCTKPNDAWNKLSNLYENSGIANKCI